MNGTNERLRVVYDTPVPPGRRRRPVLLLGGLVLGCVVLTAGLQATRSTTAVVSAPTISSSPVPPAAGSPTPAAPTREGAVRAALHSLVRMGSADMYDASTRRALLTDLVVEDAVSDLDAAYGQAAGNLGLDPRGQTAEGALVARHVPVGTEVVSYTPSTAVVEVWMTALLGIAGPESRLPVQQTWSTETVTLTWTPEGWRWASSTTSEGPVPVGSAQVPSEAGVIAGTEQLDAVDPEA